MIDPIEVEEVLCCKHSSGCQRSQYRFSRHKHSEYANLVEVGMFLNIEVQMFENPKIFTN